MTPLTQTRATPEQGGRPSSQVLVWIAIALGLATLASVLSALFRRWRHARRVRYRSQPRPPQPQAVLDLQGLTEEEAAARRTAYARQLEGQDNARGTGGAIHFKDRESIIFSEQIDTAVVDADGPRCRTGNFGHNLRNFDGLSCPSLVYVMGEAVRYPLYRSYGLAVDDKYTIIPIIFDIFLEVPWWCGQFLTGAQWKDTISIEPIEGFIHHPPLPRKE